MAGGRRASGARTRQLPAGPERRDHPHDEPVVTSSGCRQLGGHAARPLRQGWPQTSCEAHNQTGGSPYLPRALNSASSHREDVDLLLLFTSAGAASHPQRLEILLLDSQDRVRVLVGVLGPDGRVVVRSDALSEVHTQGIVLRDRSHHLTAIEQLEDLIASNATQEADLQRFFEQHPEFLLGSDYEELHPHVVLSRAGDSDLIPDFILKPVQGMSHEPAIVDLKLPAQRLVKPTPRREGLYASVNDGVMQLRTYQRFFAERQNRDYVHQHLGFTAYDPRLVLIVGRMFETVDPVVRASVLNQIRPVELITYEDVLRRQKRLLDVKGP